MKKLNEKLKKIINSANLPFVIFLIILIFIHIKIDMFNGDDLAFSKAITEENNLLQFLANRYNGWSSRLIIEMILVPLTKFELIIWKFLNIGIYILVAKSISKICSKENNKILNYIICGLLLFIPTPALNNTGWIATTTNYLWVAALGIYSLSIIINYIRERKIPKWEYILYLLATLYASNQEQMAVVMFTIFGAFLCVELIKKGYKYVIKNEKFLIILSIITILSLIFILTCPGNAVRKEKEVIKWYPEYANFRLLEKVELGLTSTMKQLVLDTNLIFVAFTLTILIGTCIYNKNKWIKLISAIPFIASIFDAFLFEHLGGLSSTVRNFVEVFRIDHLVMSLSQISIKYLFIMLLYGLILVLIPVGIYNIFKKSAKTYVCIGIYLLGLATRFIMAFSPTIFASGERTFMFLYFSFIICTILILDKIFNENNKSTNILDKKKKTEDELSKRVKIKA